MESQNLLIDNMMKNAELPALSEADVSQANDGVKVKKASVDLQAASQVDEAVKVRVNLSGDRTALNSLGEIATTDTATEIFPYRESPTETEGAPAGTSQPAANNNIDISGLVQSDEYASRQVIVKLKPGIQTNEISSLKNNLNATVVKSTTSLGIELWELNSMTAEEAIATYANDPRVAYIEPNYQVSIVGTPNDPSFNELWGLHNTGQQGGTPDADIDAPEAWDIQTGSSDVVVGVIDTGVDYTHPDLDDNIWTNQTELNGESGVDDDDNGYMDDIHGYDFFNNDGDPFDDNGHGTHVSGTIAAEGNNGIGVAGVSWDAQIMGLKFLGADGFGDTFAAIQAIEYAIKMGAKLTSNSWAGGGFSQGLYDAIAAAGVADQLFIAAASNEGSDNDVSPAYPASYDLDNIIAVAATDRYDNLAGFSNYGAESVDLGAPGVDVYSTVPYGDGYDTYSGTSMATPHVSGVASLLWANNPDMSAEQVKNRILASVDPIPALDGITVSEGRLNAFRALAEAGKSAIRGTKWNDQDADGVRDEGEPGLEGWGIYLDLNNNGELDESVNEVESTDIPKSILDEDTISSTIEVSDLVGAIADVNVTLDITHTWDNDVDAFLIGPSGKKIELFTDVGGDGDNFTNTTLDDEANTSITEGIAPFTGSFKPEGSLAEFDSEALNGTWTLEITDDAKSDVGTLNNWSLSFTTLEEPFTQTDANGNYAFNGLEPGTYTVAEVPQEGWEQTFPEGDGTHTVTVEADEIADDIDFGNRDTTVGLIKGSKWHDLDGDGLQEVDEPGLEGWTIYFDENDNGQLDDGEQSTVTDENGDYVFLDLDPETYTVAEVLQEGWEQTFPVDGVHEVVLAEGEIEDDIDFGNQALPGEIHGKKWEDIDGDGVQDDGEQALSGWTIYLDENQNGQLDNGEVSTVTDTNGNYSFTDLDYGTYTVAEVQQQGWQQTYPDGGGVSSDVLVFMDAQPWGSDALLQVLDANDIERTVVDSSQMATIDMSSYDVVFISSDQSQYFYDTYDTNASIFADYVNDGGTLWVGAASQGWNGGDFSGSQLPEGVTVSNVFEDYNDVVDTSHPLMAGVPSPFYGTSASHAAFNNLPEDAEIIARGQSSGLPTTIEYDYGAGNVLAFGQTLEFGYANGQDAGQILENSVPYAFEIAGGELPGAHIVKLDPGETLDGIDFGNRVIIPGDIQGSKWNDLNGNSLWDQGESALPGWTIYLDDNQNGQLDDGEVSTVTDSNGNYSFTDLDPGTYTVAEVLQPGWQQTYPGGGGVTGDALVFMDAQPWGSDALLQVLDANNIERTVVDSSQMATIDMSSYDVVFISSDQSQYFYNTYDTNASIFADYVNDGGTLWVGAASLGWNGGDFSGSQLPEGVTVSNVFEDYNDVVDTSHPLMAGVPDPFYGTSASHAAFNNLPEDATVIARGQSSGLPTTIEYDYGAGNVLAFGQTLEFGYANGQDAGQILENSVPYAFELAGGELPGPHIVELDNGESETGINFGNQELLPGEIRGSKWNDVNGDGVWDEGESALPGWTIYLDENQNGQLDDGEVSTVTDSNGNYTFTELDAGTYTVAEVLQDGWQQTYPTLPGDYTWTDSDQPGGPTFNWVEISGVGTPIFFSDDSFQEVSLPFSFSFFGEEKNTVKISSNGYLAFGTEATTYVNTPIPNPNTPNDFIAAFWDDLYPPNGGSFYHYYDAAENQFIVEYSGVPHINGGGPYTFEIILDADDDSILFQYLDVNAPVNSATIGVENSDGSDGLQVAFDSEYVHDNLAVEIVAAEGLPAPHTVEVDNNQVVEDVDFGNQYIVIPDISIDDVTVTEGDVGTTNATFTVSLSEAIAQTVTVEYSTADGTATAPEDYTGINGILTFDPGETEQTITVSVNGDTIVESDETFFVNLTNADNGAIADSQALATILDDDTVGGNPGHDSLMGTPGHDTLDGGPGNDTLDGLEGHDSLIGGTGHDSLIGDDGHDTLDGGEGHDTLKGGSGHDLLNGGEGHDILRGGSGKDTLTGGAGDDSLEGGDGKDILIGVDPSDPNPGQDELDSLTGGAGTDRFVLGDAIGGPYYDDGNQNTSGADDFALLTDFNSSDDFIQLAGSASNYVLSAIASDTNIYLDNDGTLGFSSNDELIGRVAGVTNLNLSSGYFAYV